MKFKIRDSFYRFKVRLNKKVFIEFKKKNLLQNLLSSDLKTSSGYRFMGEPVGAQPNITTTALRPDIEIA